MTKQNEINNVVLSLFSFDEHRMARTVYAAHDLEIDWRRFYNTIVILEGKGLLKKKYVPDNGKRKASFLRIETIKRRCISFCKSYFLPSSRYNFICERCQRIIAKDRA